MVPYARAGVQAGKATATCPACQQVFTGKTSKTATAVYAKHYATAHAG